ncbi:MAG: protein-export chaperone SecB [Methylococcales bacterium]
MNNIRISSFKAEHISLVQKNIEKDDFELGFNIGFSEGESKTFVIQFKTLISSSSGYELTVEYVSIFEADEIITEDFKSSGFVTINAPAIAYPFLRSFISTITLNAGYEPVLIPTINFQALAQQHNGFSKKESID